MATQSPSRAVVRPTRVRYLVIVFAVALAVVPTSIAYVFPFAAPLISKDLGTEPRCDGMAFTAFGWAYALFEIPGGYLGDRLGPRSVLMRIVLWWSFSPRLRDGRGTRSRSRNPVLLRNGRSGLFSQPHEDVSPRGCRSASVCARRHHVA